MTNLEKYDQAFIECFGVSREALPSLEYQSVAEWDSVGHMGLIATLEDAFDIMFDTDGILDFSSYEKGKEIVKSYGVEL